jgi:hypothetical protein
MHDSVIGLFVNRYEFGEFQPSSDADGLPPVILPPLDRYAYVSEPV